MEQHEQRWRAEFENLGYETVRDDMAAGGLRVIGGTSEKQECARKWLREQEGAQSKAIVQDRENARRSLRVAHATYVVSALILLVVLVVSVLTLLVALWK
jgi:hypothetical protein